MLLSSSPHHKEGSLGLGYQRTRSRKQTVPQRACPDSGMTSNPISTLGRPRLDQPVYDCPASSLDIPARLGPSFASSGGATGPSLPSPTGLNNAAAPPIGQPAAAQTVEQPAAAKAARLVKAAGKKHPAGAVKACRNNGVPRPLKPGLCGFCGQTWSPIWRRGPEVYTPLCNACGLRFQRRGMGAFTQAHYNKATAAVQAAQVGAPSMLNSHAVHSSRSSTEAQAPAAAAAPTAAAVTGSRLGKRMRKATAKAMESEAIQARGYNYVMFKGEPRMLPTDEGSEEGDAGDDISWGSRSKQQRSMKQHGPSSLACRPCDEAMASVGDTHAADWQYCDCGGTSSAVEQQAGRPAQTQADTVQGPTAQEKQPGAPADMCPAAHAAGAAASAPSDSLAVMAQAVPNKLDDNQVQLHSTTAAAAAAALRQHIMQAVLLAGQLPVALPGAASLDAHQQLLTSAASLPLSSKLAG